MTIGDVAAGLGVPCFPCNAEKRPVTTNGFKAASVERSRILAMFEMPGAELIGMPTGEISNSVFLDYDVRGDPNGLTWLENNRGRLPQTRTHKTRSDGRHQRFNYPNGYNIRNSASRIAPGVDVRANGGYVIVPPSAGYEVIDDSEPADMPLWLIKLCLAPEFVPPPRSPPRPLREDGGSRYGLKALIAECNAISSAPYGQQETTLNSAALKIGGLVAGGELQESVAVADLVSAGLNMSSEPNREPWRDTDIRSKVQRALADGKATPRSAPLRSESPSPAGPSEPPEPITDPGYWASVDEDHGLAIDKPVPPDQPHIWHSTEPWNEADLPVRPWIVPGALMRGTVTLLAGASSAGKSSLCLSWAVACVFGRVWSRFKPRNTCIVSLYNVEDNDDEQRRRISATLRQFGAQSTDLVGKLHRLGPHNIGTLIERDPQTNRLRRTDAFLALVDHLNEVRPDVLFLDPMVELHNADENDNTALRAIMAELRTLAKEFNMAIVLVHHARKGSAGLAGDPDIIRGAGAIVGAARIAVTISVMTEEEAGELNVPVDDRFLYFRVDSAKQNYAKIEAAEWFQRVEYLLQNGEAVPAAEPWQPPSLWRDMRPSDITVVLNRIEAGPSPGILYAPSNRGAQNNRWVGNLLMEVMSVNETQAASIVRTWLQTGLLVEKVYRDLASRKDRTGVTVDRTKTP